MAIRIGAWDDDSKFFEDRLLELELRKKIDSSISEKKHNNINIHEVIEYLEGSSNTLEHAITVCTNDTSSIDDLSIEQLQYINEHIFICDTCGWWNEISDMSAEDQLCQGCFDDDVY